MLSCGLKGVAVGRLWWRVNLPESRAYCRRSRSAPLRSSSCRFVVGQVCFTLALSLPDESRDGQVVLAGLSTLLVVRRVGRMPEMRSWRSW